MIRKILFFFLLSLSFTRFYSQKDLSISLQGKVQNKENKENLFGATLYLMDKDVFISKSVSLSNGTFLLTAKIPRSDTYDLIVSKNGFILKKILIDLSSLDFIREYQNNIPLKKDMNINLYSQSLFPNINNSDSFYSEKYNWSRDDKKLIIDENYLIQAEEKLKQSNTPIAKVIIDSAAIKIQDETIISNLSDILKQAKSFSKEKNLKLSIDKYNEAELLSSKLSNSNSNQLFISALKAEKSKLLEAKNSEDLVFNSQLIKANEYFLLGQNGYAKAKLILRTDPMRGRVNDPKVIDLTDKINQMESYFNMKKTAYLLVKSKKKNQEAITSLKITQEKAILNQKIIPQNELVQLKKSIDSLENIINPMLALIPKKVIEFIWYKNGPFKDNILNDLLYHDLYLIIHFLGVGFIENLKINKNTYNKFKVSFIYKDVLVKIDYDREYQGNKKKIIKIDDFVLDLSLPTNDPLSESIQLCFENKIDYIRNHHITLETTKLLTYFYD